MPNPRPHHKIALLLWLLAALCPLWPACSAPDPCAPNSFAQRPPECITQGTFTLLTYNVHGLPEGITGDDTAGRMKQISPKLNAYTLVAIQENFAHSELLMQDVKQPHVHHSDETMQGRAYSSGLSFLSQHPFTQKQGTPWSDCNGVVDSSNDCLAAKGYQWLRVALNPARPAMSVDIYNLHMDAGGSQKDHDTRSKQVTQLLAAIEKNSKGLAVIVVGDTNMRTRSNGVDDMPLLQRLLQEAQLKDVCTTLSCPAPSSIDRFLYRSSPALELTPTKWHEDKSFVDVKGKPLSDHPANVATFQYKNLVQDTP